MTDGRGDEAARGGGGDEEAAWLELIGRFDAPAGTSDAPVPWPDRENLSAPGQAGDDTARSGDRGEDGPWTGPGDRTGRPDGLDERYGLGERGPGGPGLGERGLGERRGAGERGPGGGGLGDGGPRPGADAERPWPAIDPATNKDRPWSAADTDQSWAAADTGGATTGWNAPWPPAEDTPPADEDALGEGSAGTGLRPDTGPAPDGRFVLPTHQPLDVPSPPVPRSWSPPDEDEGHFVPPPPPPLPSMAPGTKAAWTGLFGGPGYLLVATLAGWSVPGWALFLAIAAFVGGFTVLVLRQNDQPDDDSGPDDDGAVV